MWGRRFATFLLLAWCSAAMAAQEPAPPMPVCRGGDTTCVNPPKAISHPDPTYSEEAARAGLQGKVVLRALVTSEGIPGNIRVVKSLGMGLDEQAAEAVSHWRFEPATLDGKPVGVELNIEVNFRLYHKDQAPAANTSSAASQNVPAGGSGNQAEHFFRDGTAAFGAQHYAAAAIAWKHVVQLDPEHPEAWNSLCRADFELKLMADAEESCRKQIAIAPEHKFAHNNLARALWAEGKLGEAEQEFRKQIEIDPQNHWAHENLGMLLAKEGKCGAAVPKLETGHRTDSPNQKAADALRQCYVQTGQTEKAAGLPTSAPMGGVIGGIIASTPVAVPKVATPMRVRVSSGVEASNLIQKVQPVYPAVAKSARIQGDVVLRALINKEGAVESLEAISGHPLLIPPAVDAVKQWQYKPYHLNGEPVPVETTIVVHFTLGENN